MACNYFFSATNQILGGISGFSIPQISRGKKHLERFQP